MSDYFLDIQSGTFVTATDTNLHFPGDGIGSLTTEALAAGAATYTATTATPAGNVGTLGTKGYAFCPSSGHYAPYVVTTAGVGGTIAVDVWRNVNPALIGTVPSGNITLHTTSIAAAYRQTNIVALQIRGNITAATALSITDAVGTVVRGFKIPVSPTPGEYDWGGGLIEVRGPFGIKLGTTAQLDAGLSFQLSKPLAAGVAFNNPSM